MKKLAFTIAALAAASACTAAAQPNEHRGVNAGRAECTIDVTRTRHGLRFEALARSFAPASGEYELVLTKHDRGGSSDIVQGGAYRLAAGDENLLGSSEFSLERGGRYRARLVLWDGDREVCRVTRRS